jgi:hypothetical protein
MDSGERCRPGTHNVDGHKGGTVLEPWKDARSVTTEEARR